MLEKISDIVMIILAFIAFTAAALLICKNTLDLIEEQKDVKKNKVILLCVYILILVITISSGTVLHFKRRTVSEVNDQLVRTRTEIQLTEQSVSEAISTIGECRTEVGESRGTVEECRGTLSELGNTIDETGRILEEIGRTKAE